MEKIRLAIVEDDELWQNQIEKEILEIWGENIEICIYESGEQFLEVMHFFHIVCMDVELQGIDGFDTSEKYKKIYPEAILLILTMHTEWSRKGYVVDVFRYIDKDNLKKELEEAFRKIKERLSEKRTLTIYEVSVGKRTLYVRDILYAETEKRHVLVHTRKDSYCCRETLKELAGKLIENFFLSPNRSYLVNMEWIEEINSSDVIIKTGEKIHLSRGRYQKNREKFLLWKLDYDYD